MTRRCNNNRLENKKLLGFIFFIILICLGSGMVSIYISNSALVETNSTYLPQIAKQASLAISTSINTELKMLETIADNDKIVSGDVTLEDKLEALKVEIKRTNSIDIGIADKAGNVKSINGDCFNVSEETYFKKAILGQSNVSDAIMNKKNKMVVLYNVPIREQEKIIGVMIFVRDGNELSSNTGEIKFGESGRAYVLNNMGNVIAHQNKDLVLKQDNTIKDAEKDSSLKNLAEIEKKMINKENGYGQYQYEGKEKYIGYAPIKNTDWSIAIVTEKEEMLKNVGILKRGVVMASYLFIASGIIVIIIILGRLVRPVNKSDRYCDSCNNDLNSDI